MRPDQSSARGARVVLTTLAVALVAAIAATPASAAPSTGLVVNEVYGGGGNSGATYTNDFVEIANRGSSPVDVSGWSVQYHAATGTGAWQVTPLSGSIAPGQFYLVAEAAGAGGPRRCRPRRSRERSPWRPPRGPSPWSMAPPR